MDFTLIARIAEAWMLFLPSSKYYPSELVACQDADLIWLGRPESECEIAISLS